MEEVSGQVHVLAALPEEIAPHIHWIRVWVGPGAGLDAMEKRNILPLPGIKSWLSSIYPVAILTELSPLLPNYYMAISNSFF
jgi:hypothetical protein